METDEAQRVLPFQLQFDKAVATQNGTLRRICWRWSPKIPRFCCTASIDRGSVQSLQVSLALYNLSRSITSLRWRPDGKAIAVGLEDGTVSLHDVETRAFLGLVKQYAQDPVVHLEMESEKVRSIPHSVVAPLAVSPSRAVACVFAARKRVLVYILDEDEDEVSDAE